MKKLLVLVLSLVMMSTAFADAKLRVNISGDTGNRYFLCVGGNGCVSIAAGDRGQVFPIDSGAIQAEHIYATDISTLRMSDQTLPRSCNVTVNDNQTLTVSGRIIMEGNGNTRVARISGLNCHVA